MRLYCRKCGQRLKSRRDTKDDQGVLVESCSKCAHNARARIAELESALPEWHPGVKDLPDDTEHGMSPEVEIRAKAAWDYWQNKWLISEVIGWRELSVMPEGE